MGAEIVRLLQPLGVDAAVRAITDCEHQAGEKQRQLELALEQARYETARARRQYDAVDPDNRLVAGELERRWNAALAAVDVLEKELETLVRQRPAALGAEEGSGCCKWVLTWSPLGIIRRRPPSRASVSSAL